MLLWIDKLKNLTREWFSFANVLQQNGIKKNIYNGTQWGKRT